MTEIGPCVGFCVTLGFHGLIISMIFVLTMRQEETLQTSDVSFMETLLSHQVLLFMLGGFGLLITCLAWGLVLKPGILAKVNLANSENVVTKIC